MTVLAICPQWPPDAGYPALQAAARLSELTGAGAEPAPGNDGDTVHLVTRAHLGDGPPADQVRSAWDLLGGWIGGHWTYRRIYSGPGDLVGHLVAATQKLRHPDTPWEAHLTTPPGRPRARPDGTDPVPDPAAEPLPDAGHGVRAEVLQGAAALGIQLPEDGSTAVWVEHLVLGLADEVVAASRPLSEALQESATRILPTGRSGPSRHRVWSGLPWPVPGPVTTAPRAPQDASPGRPGAAVTVLACDPGTGSLADLLDTVLELAPASLAQTVQLAVLESAGVGTPAGLARVLGADVVVLSDLPSPQDPADGLVAPFPADLLTGGQAPALWAVTREHTDLAGRDAAYRSPLNHPTAALLVLDRIRRHRSGRG